MHLAGYRTEPLLQHFTYYDKNNVNYFEYIHIHLLNL